ncbi:MAG TPA: ATP-binding protein, partial [Puia sp.]
HGGTDGMICANTDDTERIISERQLKTLTHLASRLKDTHTNSEVVSRTVSTLSENAHDFPFVLFFSIEDNEAFFSDSSLTNVLSLIHSKRFRLDSKEPLAVLFRDAGKDKKVVSMAGVRKYLGVMPNGAWEKSSDTAILLPLTFAGAGKPFGFLIIGCNPYRLLNEKYLSFFSLIADQIATSFSSINILEQERKRAEALAEIDRAKTTFFSNISHEFRTPLTLLLGPIEDALNNPETLQRNKEGLVVAHRNALRMQKLVNTLLEFSRLEAGRLDGKFGSVDIIEITTDLVSTFRSAIEKAGMELEVKATEIAGSVYVDIDMWEKIILNLVSNAFKYSSKGKISVDIEKFENQLQVIVADTGTGIPADKVDKIFDRFYRVENIEGRSQEGTGIGLALVKELVKIHKGSISVESTVGIGSRFTVHIPMGKEHLPPEKILETSLPASPTAYSTAILDEAQGWLTEPDNGREFQGPEELNVKESSADLSKPKIVLADDNTDMRSFLTKILSSHFSVITAVDGEDAFNKVLKFRPELVIADIMMPRLDGFELLKKHRLHPDIRNIPVIFLSARAGEEAKVEGLRAGADDYLTKPFSAKELIVRISNHININRVRRETERQFFLLFQQAPALINVMKGPLHRFEFYHPKNKEFLGLPDFSGMTVREAFPNLEGQGIFEMLDDVYRNGVTIQHNERFVSFLDEKGERVDKYMNITY